MKTNRAPCSIQKAIILTKSGKKKKNENLSINNNSISIYLQ